MNPRDLPPPRFDGQMDKTALFVIDSFEEGDRLDREYWHVQTPQDRIRYLEHLRRINYGHDQVSAPMKRVLELVDPHEA